MSKWQWLTEMPCKTEERVKWKHLKSERPHKTDDLLPSAAAHKLVIHWHVSFAKFGDEPA